MTIRRTITTSAPIEVSITTFGRDRNCFSLDMSTFVLLLLCRGSNLLEESIDPRLRFHQRPRVTRLRVRRIRVATTSLIEPPPQMVFQQPLRQRTFHKGAGFVLAHCGEPRRLNRNSAGIVGARGEVPETYSGTFNESA